MRVVKKTFEESGYVGFVFNRSELDSDIEDLDYDDLIEYLGSVIQKNGHYICAYYGGPGQAFANTPSVLLGKSRVLVTQYFGVDV